MADNTTINAGSGGDEIATDDVAGVKHQRVKVEFGTDGVATDVSATDPLPVDDADAQAALASILAKLSSDPATQATLAAILAKLSGDPATQTTLAAVLSALQGSLTVGLPSGAATSAAQATEATKLDTLHADIVTLQGYVDGLEGKDYATQTSLAAAKTVLDNILLAVDGLETNTTGLATQITLAAVLAKLTSDPSTATLQGSANTKLDTIVTSLTTIDGHVDGLEGFTDGIEGKLDTLHTDAGTLATQTTAAAILAKLSSDPATQTTLAAVLSALQGSLTVALPSGASTSAKQDTQSTKLDTLHTDLGLVATQATLASVLTALGHLTDGTQSVLGVPLASETLANVSSSATVVTLQASNAARRSWSCFNDSTSALYVKFGATATTSSFTVKVAAGGYYEMPLPAYTGAITGIWDSANGSARVTEGA